MNDMGTKERGLHMELRIKVAKDPLLSDWLASRIVEDVMEKYGIAIEVCCSNAGSGEADSKLVRAEPGAEGYTKDPWIEPEENV